ncbi:hypothetical protein G9A89_014220 [Geosiphon pyriformis]|nr:hypothetical protein G9A89_014220 [Geosiphon pyriformis]
MLILLWNDNPKGKQREKLIWETDDLTWINNNEQEPTPSWEWEESNKGKEKVKEEKPLPTNPYISYQYTTPQQFTYCRPKLVCINCSKKLSSMGACCGNNKKYQTATKFYLEKWDNTLCLACGETLLDERLWNNISRRGETCDMSCQYMILISDWVEKGTPIEAIWRRAVQ